MLSSVTVSAIWMAVLASLVQTTFAQNGEVPIGGSRIYNPPSDGMRVYKLRQWTQQPQDKPWCVTGKQVINIGEAQRNLQEEECTLTADRQLINQWEVVPGSLAYMLRFSDSGLCMTVEDGQYGMRVRRDAESAKHFVDASLFNAPLVHLGKVPTHADIKRRAILSPVFEAIGVKGGKSVAKPNETDHMTPLTPDAPKPVVPVADPSKNANPDGSAIDMSKKRTPVILSQCVGNDNQIFKARIVTRPNARNNYYQLMSYKYKTCLASERKNLADIAIVPCTDNDESQLWLFEDIVQTIADAGVSDLTFDEKQAVNRVLPGSLEVFDMTFELARYVNTYARNILQYQQSGTVVVSKLVAIFLNPEQRPQAWEKLWELGKMFIGFIPLPGPFNIIKSVGVKLTDMILGQLAQHQKDKPATPQDLIQWDVYALKQAEYTVDALLNAFTEVFRQSSINDLRTLLQEFKANKYHIAADKFYHEYQVRFSQKLLTARAGDFWTSVCVSRGNDMPCNGRWSGKNYRMGDRTYENFYSTNINKDGISYLESIGEKDNFYKANNGWNLDRYYYTCPGNNGGVCVARMVLRQNKSSFDVIA
ncbi:hypothetical protein BDF19DRAFT_448705 [Syncephalis fuscata]|nr:hypothetical protein BDF19DRAFT_448705 [Syncephalis fuscata]